MGVWVYCTCQVTNSTLKETWRSKSANCVSWCWGWLQGTHVVWSTSWENWCESRCGVWRKIRMEMGCWWRKPDGVCNWRWHNCKSNKKPMEEFSWYFLEWLNIGGGSGSHAINTITCWNITNKSVADVGLRWVTSITKFDWHSIRCNTLRRSVKPRVWHYRRWNPWYISSRCYSCMTAIKLYPRKHKW